MNSYFIFNDEHSIEDYGLYFETMPILPLSSVSEVASPQITCTLGMSTDKNNLLEIRRWLSSNRGKLLFSFDDRIFEVTNVIAQESIKNKTFTILTIIFEVKKECHLELRKLDVKKNFDSITLDNSGNFIAYPKMYIEGSGNVTIAVNGNIISTIENVGGGIVIDCELEECYAGDFDDVHALKNRDYYGEFPTLQLGLNTISITSTSGDVRRVVIDQRLTI